MALFKAGLFVRGDVCVLGRSGRGSGGGSFLEAVWGEVFWRPVGWRVGGADNRVEGWVH